MKAVILQVSKSLKGDREGFYRIITTNKGVATISEGHFKAWLEGAHLDITGSTLRELPGAVIEINSHTAGAKYTGYNGVEQTSNKDGFHIEGFPEITLKYESLERLLLVDRKIELERKSRANADAISDLLNDAKANDDANTETPETAKTAKVQGEIA